MEISLTLSKFFIIDVINSLRLYKDWYSIITYFKLGKTFFVPMVDKPPFIGGDCIHKDSSFVKLFLSNDGFVGIGMNLSVVILAILLSQN